MAPQLPLPKYTMSDDQAKSILSEFVKRHGTIKSGATRFIDFDADLFDLQRSVIDSPAKTIYLLCGRRGGKSTTAAYALVKTAYEYPGINCAYINLSRKLAKGTLWSDLLAVCDRYSIKYEPNATDLTIKLANGSNITLTGANNEKELQKHRGMKYKLVWIDECGVKQFIPLLPTLIDEVLAYTLIDYDGKLVLSGTPGDICAGRFYEATNRAADGISLFKWNMLDNPKMPKWLDKDNWRELAKIGLAEFCKEKHILEGSNKYKREALGEWTIDSDAQIFKYDPNINTFDTLPQPAGEYNYLFGLDFGVEDASAIVICAYSATDPNLYIVKHWTDNHVSPSALADIIKACYDQYRPVSIVGDSGGIGKAFMLEFERRFKIPITPANKTEKLAHIELLNDDFKRGRIKIQNQLYELIEELLTLKWLDPIQRTMYADAKDHLSHALLYCWRDAMHFIAKQVKVIKANSKEYEDMIWEQERELINNSKYEDPLEKFL